MQHRRPRELAAFSGALAARHRTLAPYCSSTARTRYSGSGELIAAGLDLEEGGRPRLGDARVDLEFPARAVAAAQAEAGPVRQTRTDRIHPPKECRRRRIRRRHRSPRIPAIPRGPSTWKSGAAETRSRKKVGSRIMLRPSATDITGRSRSAWYPARSKSRRRPRRAGSTASGSDRGIRRRARRRSRVRFIRLAQACRCGRCSLRSATKVARSIASSGNRFEGAQSSSRRRRPPDTGRTSGNLAGSI